MQIELQDVREIQVLRGLNKMDSRPAGPMAHLTLELGSKVLVELDDQALERAIMEYLTGGEATATKLALRKRISRLQLELPYAHEAPAPGRLMEDPHAGSYGEGA